MLDEPVPGLDHLKAVDRVGFAWLMSEEMDFDATQLGLKPLGCSIYAPIERERWTRAAIGLRTVRGLIALDETRPARAKDVAVLRQVESVLDAADGRDRRSYLMARDLG